MDVQGSFPAGETTVGRVRVSQANIHDVTPATRGNVGSSQRNTAVLGVHI